MATIMTRIFLTTAIVLCLFYLAINQLSTNVQTKIHETPSIDSVRICCLILTAPKYFNTRTRAVNATWAPRCDKYLFISEYSNQTNSSFPIAPIRNLSTGYSHLTKKTTLAFHYAYENLVEQFDWFVKADDDTYLIMENLRYFLQQHNSSEPVTFGYNFKVNFSPRTFQSFFQWVHLDIGTTGLSFRWSSVCVKSRSSTTILSSPSRGQFNMFERWRSWRRCGNC